MIVCVQMSPPVWYWMSLYAPRRAKGLEERRETTHLHETDRRQKHCTAQHTHTHYSRVHTLFRLHCLPVRGINPSTQSLCYGGLSKAMQPVCPDVGLCEMTTSKGEQQQANDQLKPANLCVPANTVKPRNPSSSRQRSSCRRTQEQNVMKPCRFVIACLSFYSPILQTITVSNLTRRSGNASHERS